MSHQNLLPRSSWVALVVVSGLLVSSWVALAAEAPKVVAKKPEAPKQTRVLLVPAAALGEVRPIYEKRIAKALQDVLQFSTRFNLLTDQDRPVDVAPVGDGKTVQVKGSATSRRIDEADQLRQEGTDLAAEAKHTVALAKFRAAIALYEQAYSELVDYSKLADAYARAGLSAYSSGSGAAEATRLFELGIAIQPTLVIDRRKQPKELLELFDGAHERLEKAPKATIVVDGGDAPGAEAFIDGVRVGGLPARKTDLLPGVHYVQVRGEGWQSWADTVRVRGKEVKVKTKLQRAKVAVARPVEEYAIDALAPCARAGEFHTALCTRPMQALARQTGAQFIVFAAIKADRYGRLAIHAFVADGGSAATIGLKPIDLAADLGDLNARAAEIEAAVYAATHPFAKARAIGRTPTVYGKGK